MKKKIIPFSLVILVFLTFLYFFRFQKSAQILTRTHNPNATAQIDTKNSNPLSISFMRQKSYPGSVITVEKMLSSTLTYKQYVVSYLSEGLKIYALLTVPAGQKPSGGWPVILFNHGYIPPEQYSTESSYSSFVHVFASSGYIVFKPDYRGNGNSEGSPVQPYVSNIYITDSMNALESIKQYKDANPQKIGVFGHSMGGNISLHELVITKDIKAAELMASVVGDETQILDWWDRRVAAKSITGNDLDTSFVVQHMVRDHGRPDTNPDYWNAIDPTKFLSDISVPVEIQVGTADTAVPPSFSSSLRDKLLYERKMVVYHEYPGADHNFSPNTSTALNEAVAFFKKYLK